MNNDKPRAEIMFTRTSEFLYYIVNNLDNEYNHIRFTLTSEGTGSLLADGEVNYMEDSKGMQNGMFHINIYNAERVINSKLYIPLKVNTGITDAELDLAKTGCYNTKSILKMFSKLEISGGVRYRLDIFNDKDYYSKLKRDSIIVPYTSMLTELHKLYAKGYNSFKVIVGFNNFYYNHISEFNFIHMYGGAIFTTRMYLEDSKESIVVTPSYCQEEDLYDCIIDMVNIINQALESIKYEEKYNIKDYIIIEYWREQYE